MSFGSSSSRQSTSVKNVREDNIFNSSGVEGDVLNIGKAGGDITVQRLDAGLAESALEGNRALAQQSIQSALGFGSDALAILGDNLTNAVGAQGDIVKDALSSLEWKDQLQNQETQRLLASIDSAKTDDGAETVMASVKWLALAAIGVAAAYGLTKGMKA